MSPRTLALKRRELATRAKLRLDEILGVRRHLGEPFDMLEA